MKKLIILLFITILISSCGKSYTNSKGQTFECYGLYDKEQIMKSNINYEFVKMNLIPAIIFSETLIVPIGLLMFQTHCPVGEK